MKFLQIFSNLAYINVLGLFFSENKVEIQEKPLKRLKSNGIMTHPKPFEVVS